MQGGPRGGPIGFRWPKRLLVASAFCWLLAACVLLLPPYEAMLERGRSAGFEPVRLPVESMRSMARGRASGGARTLTIYLESDGAPWPFPDQPPADPTPQRPVVVEMAAKDPSSAVAYLGRPCQYLDAEELARCDPALWMRARFSDPVVSMTNRAIDALKARGGAERLNLVGYSGGGALATLVASRRHDVACLVTIAAPLDTSEWTAAIGVSPLSESLNPAMFAGALKSVPQFHFRGLRDVLVPPVSSRRFLDVVGRHTARDMARMDHSCCWQEEWLELRRGTCLEQGR